jgi:hypothetical protein
MAAAMKRWPVPQSLRVRLKELLDEQSAAAGELRRIESSLAPGQEKAIAALCRANLKLAKWSDSHLLQFGVLDHDEGVVGTRTVMANLADGSDPRVPEFEAEEYLLTKPESFRPASSYLEDAFPTSEASPSWEVTQMWRSIAATGWPAVSRRQKGAMALFAKELRSSATLVAQLLRKGK